jgi:membrane protease YdiL (CAAX protease family)
MQTMDSSPTSTPRSALPPSPLPRARLLRETALVYGGQLVLVVALILLSAHLGWQSAVHVLVGAVFIGLPVLVLDRSDKPYLRYGLHAGRPIPGLLWAVAAAALTFTPIAAAVFAFPALWGVSPEHFRLALPPDFAVLALSHFIVVALPEEFFFRGYLLGRLDDLFPQRRRFLGIDAGPGFVLQAALFALGHFVVDFQPARLAVFFPALVFGWLRLRTGSIAPAVIYHGSANLFMVVLRTGFGLTP